MRHAKGRPRFQSSPTGPQSLHMCVMHKHDADMRYIFLYSRIFLEEEMVGVTRIEPVAPTMST